VLVVVFTLSNLSLSAAGPAGVNDRKLFNCALAFEPGMAKYVEANKAPRLALIKCDDRLKKTVRSNKSTTRNRDVAVKRIGDKILTVERGAITRETQQTAAPIQEIQIGDPPSGKQRAVSELLTLDSETAASIEQSVSGESKAAKIDSKVLALETLKLAKEYAQLRVSRKEPPTPTKVKAFLALYGLPFKYPNDQFVPYCASGVGFAAARVHHRLAWPKDHPGDTQNADPGDDDKVLRDALPDVTRDYCKTHPSTIVMMNAAKARKYPDGETFWVSSKRRPKQGWLVFFNWSSGRRPQHVGIVDGVDSSGRVLSTVEFNTSKDNPSNGGNVVAKKRNVRYVVGYIRTYL